ncbi:hypothetical protein ACLOJK_023027 [Asimina triloba]
MSSSIKMDKDESALGIPPLVSGPGQVHGYLKVGVRRIVEWCTPDSWVSNLHETSMEWELSLSSGRGIETSGLGAWPSGGGRTLGS